jgi:hypothetical protein
MKNSSNCNDYRTKDEGHIITVILVLIALAAVSISGILQANASHHRINFASNVRAERFYEVESAVGKAGGWLLKNSQNITSAFLQANLYSSFDRTASSVGDNDGDYPNETRIKIDSTNNSVILTNNASLGTNSFPTTIKADSTVFNPVADFANEDFGDILVKITMLDAIADNPALDNGITPTTDFAPIFRIDAMSALDRGAHVYSYFVGKLLESTPAGFFGLTGVSNNRDCDGYDSSVAAYSSGTATATCPIGSHFDICIDDNATIMGTVKALGDIDLSASCGGTVCEDTACTRTSQGCSGSMCLNEDYPVYSTFDTYCTADQGDLTISGTQTLTVSGDDPSQKCWDEVVVEDGGRLFLSTTGYDYFFRSLVFEGNGQIRTSHDDATADIVLYVNQLESTVGAGKLRNLTSQPSKMKVVYLGNSDVTLNTNIEAYLKFIAPNARVFVTGGQDFFGSIVAYNLDIQGSGELHFDGDLGDSETRDLSFGISQITQYNR